MWPCAVCQTPLFSYSTPSAHAESLVNETILCLLGGAHGFSQLAHSKLKRHLAKSRELFFSFNSSLEGCSSRGWLRKHCKAV